MGKRILIVEDEASIREVLVEFLVDAGYQVEEAEDGLVGLRMFNNQTYNLIITDVMMPRMDGFELVEKIRASSQVPIIVLTALSSETDQMRAYNIAADDFITKPFSPLVLTKKIENLFRRLEPDRDAAGPRVLGDITIDKSLWLVQIKGKSYSLSVKEFDLFQALIEHEKEVLTREWLMRNVWGYDFVGDTRVIDTQIKNLRKKLGNNVIETVHGVGYRIIVGGIIDG